MSAVATSKPVPCGFLTLCLQLCSSRRIIKRPSFILYLLLHNVHVRLVHLIFVLCNHGMDKTSGSIYMYLDNMQDITSMLKHSNNVKPHVLIYLFSCNELNKCLYNNTVFRIHNHWIGRQSLFISLQYYFYCSM